MTVTDIRAIKKWNELPDDVKELLLSNVFCSTCGVTTIVEYSMQIHKYGILLNGKCKKCHREVARLVED